MLKKLLGTGNKSTISVGCDALHLKQRHRKVRSTVAIHHATQHTLVQSAGLPRCAYGAARNDAGWVGRMMVLLTFLFILFTAFPAAAQSRGLRMKLVFPIGEGTQSIKVCDPQYQTASGCCEPPQSIYQYTPTIKGCCTPPNEVHGTGTNERCCTPQGGNQERWGQSDDFPCGQLCTQPNTVITYEGEKGCCPPEGANQERWDQTAEFPCGQLCTQPNTVVTYEGEKDCCPPLPDEYFRINRSPSNVCGDYITCGVGATLNAEGTACVCDTAVGYKGTWKEDTGDGTGNGCEAPAEACQILVADASGVALVDIEAKGDTITYNGNMVISKNINIDACHLIVNATSGQALVVNNGITLKAKKITATVKGGLGDMMERIVGVSNGGTIEATDLTAKIIDSTINFHGFAYGILNNGVIKSTNVTGEVFDTILNPNASVHGVSNNKTIEAKTVTGEVVCDSNVTNPIIGGGFGVYNMGSGDAFGGTHTASIKADIVTGIGTHYGVYNMGSGGAGAGSRGVATITATTVSGVGSFYGLYNMGSGGAGPGSSGSGQIVATRIYYCFAKYNSSGSFSTTPICANDCTCTN